MNLELKPIELQRVETKQPIIIAGPCSAETEEQVMSTATPRRTFCAESLRGRKWSNLLCINKIRRNRRKNVLC